MAASGGPHSAGQWKRLKGMIKRQNIAKFFCRDFVYFGVCNISWCNAPERKEEFGLGRSSFKRLGNVFEGWIFFQPMVPCDHTSQQLLQGRLIGP